MQIGFNKYNVYFTNSYYRFDSNFIRFSLFILSTKGVKPYLCRIKSNFAPDMTQVKMKIMSWKNGLLLSAVSYVFYLVMWFILDDKTIDQLPGMTIADYMVDFLLCMLFTYISLGFCFLVFRVLPFRTSYVWGMVYASCLMALNNIVAFGMITLFNFLWDETDNGLLDELLNMKGAYTFAMISTFLSSVYANSFYQQYAEAVKLLRADRYITVQEVAERCNVSYSGLEQHLIFYHKELVENRIKIRERAVRQQRKGKITGRGTLHAATPETITKYAEALHLYRTTPMSARKIAKQTGVSIRGFYDYLQTWHKDLICKRKASLTRKVSPWTGRPFGNITLPPQPNTLTP